MTEIKSLELLHIKDCPVCESHKVSTVISSEVVTFNRNNNKSIRQYDALNVDLHLCLNCDFAFVSPIPLLPNFFKLKYQVDDYQKKYAFNSKTQINQDIINLIKNNLESHSSWLDVGCGDGKLLDLAAAHKFEVFGVEQGDHTEQQVARVFVGSLDELLQKSPKRYDIVTLVDVLEHLERPREVVSKLESAINEKGLLYIKVPNYKFQLLKQNISNFLGISKNGIMEQLDHINHFTPTSLTYLLRKSGFDVLSTGICRSESYENNSASSRLKNLFRYFVFFLGKVLEKINLQHLALNFYILARRSSESVEKDRP